MKGFRSQKWRHVNRRTCVFIHKIEKFYGNYDGTSEFFLAIYSARTQNEYKQFFLFDLSKLEHLNGIPQWIIKIKSDWDSWMNYFNVKNTNNPDECLSKYVAFIHSIYESEWPHKIILKVTLIKDIEYWNMKTSF